MKKTGKSVEVKINNVDQLAWMSDEEVINLLSSLERDREAVLSSGRNPYPLEIELCYAQREWEIRNQRKETHKNWLVSMGENVGYDSQE